MSREYWVPEDLWRIVKSYLLVPNINTVSKEYWVPDGIWRIVKSYLFYKEFYIGDVIYGIPKRLHNNSQNYNHFAGNKYGIVIDKTGKYKKATYYISVPEFGGDYLVLSHIGMNIREKKMDAIEKLIMVNKFGGWWYPLHKSVFQELMIETLC